ncbi:hypothetical protein Tco_0391394, partial [Tanacetum coccineum]
MLTQEYMKKVVKDVGGDEDFKSGSWVIDTDYVNANCGIISQVQYLEQYITKSLVRVVMERIVGIKRLLDDFRVTAAQVCVTAAKL